ncbi:MAG: Spy/CpxP family protein refolding chaperone [Pseudoflavonifractor sp.]|nr:Spy/CpxP family protein refolding chaperone [Alloprevotella sp.]MCM1116838.1 Spy/CpxP family protein refolding chaperone [Pseudoflavonifractor sp.]
MTRYLFALILVAIASLHALADSNDRDKWMQEMQQHQNDFIAREIGLTDKQRADFLPLYNKMRSETFEASRAARAKAKAVRDKADSATDADYDAATQAYLDFRSREAKIIQEYYKKFSHILSKKQLFKLDGAERKFDRMLMNHRPGKSREGKHKDKK